MGLSADHDLFWQMLAELQGRASGVPTVRDGARTRSLSFNALDVQSAMRISDPFALQLPYTRAMMLFELFRPDPEDILIVGLGGGSLSKYCYRQFPNARVTTVEIDERVIALREQFFIPADSDRFQVVHADAAAWLAANVGAADVILLDGFDASGLPSNLASQSFYDNCHAALRDEGVLVANLLSDDSRLAVYLERLRRACGGRMMQTAARGGGNTIAVGVRHRVVPGWPELYARATAIAASRGLDLRRYVRSMQRDYERGMQPDRPALPAACA